MEGMEREWGYPETSYPYPIRLLNDKEGEEEEWGAVGWEGVPEAGTVAASSLRGTRDVRTTAYEGRR